MAVKDWDAHPKCSKCQAEITFLHVKGKDGAVRAHPVNVEKHPTIAIVLSEEKAYTGEALYKYRRVYISHFATCPEAQSFREQGKGKADAKRKNTDRASERDVGEY